MHLDGAFGLKMVNTGASCTHTALLGLIGFDPGIVPTWIYHKPVHYEAMWFMSAAHRRQGHENMQNPDITLYHPEEWIHLMQLGKWHFMMLRLKFACLEFSVLIRLLASIPQAYIVVVFIRSQQHWGGAFTTPLDKAPCREHSRLDSIIELPLFRARACCFDIYALWRKVSFLDGASRPTLALPPKLNLGD